MSERNLVGFVYNPRVLRAADFVASLVKSLNLQKNSWVSSSVDPDVDSDTLADTSAIITAGGDGTILRVVRLAAPFSVPILGVNMGRVGFMTELSLDEARDRIPDYLEGNPRVEERMMLQASVSTGDTQVFKIRAHALNDVVVTRGTALRILEVTVCVNGAPLATYRADGVIMATATGSTGYALSAGGSVLSPEARAILIQPLAPHMSFGTGLIVPDGSVIELQPSAGYEATLSVDGFTDTTLGSDDRVKIEPSSHVALFLRAESKHAFYSTLTRRLGVKDNSPTPLVDI